MASNTRTPYDNAKRLINPTAVPSWINSYDALRVSSYQLFEDIYWTEPDTFKLTQRGNEANPIYIPSGRIICNTMDRYAGQDWTPVVDESLGTPNEQALLLRTLTDFIRRERLKSQHEGNKLYGIIRGDEMWYITGNPAKPQGSRLSLRPLDPRMVIPINPEKDVDRIIGYDIVEQVTIGETLYVNRTRYLKAEHPDHPSFPSTDPLTPISWQVDNLEMENWEDPNEVKVFQSITPPTLMPGITALPIYHIKNQEEPGNPFGRSEMAGVERIFAAINQSITDEELALALHGLGMYKSGKGQPRDPVTQRPMPWQLGPGKVVHDETFERVNGVTSVTPFLEHIQYMEDRMHRINGASDVAQGVVDVTVAESGIALKLRMGPILNAARKKNTLRTEVYDQMFYDLRSWFQTYEGINFGDAQVVNNFGSGVPVDTKAEFDRLYQMVTADPPLITMGYFREACRELGMNIPLTETGENIAAELAGFQAVADPTGGRLDAEIDAAEEGAVEAGAGDGEL